MRSRASPTILTCLGMAAQRGERADRDVLHAGGARAALLYDLVEAVTGARLTVSWCRVGGIARDLPEDFGDRIKFAFKNLDAVLDDCDKLLSRNRIFIEPMSGIGKMSKEDAISYGLTARDTGSTSATFGERRM